MITGPIATEAAGGTPAILKQGSANEGQSGLFAALLAMLGTGVELEAQSLAEAGASATPIPPPSQADAPLLGIPLPLWKASLGPGAEIEIDLRSSPSPGAEETEESGNATPSASAADDLASEALIRAALNAPFAFTAGKGANNGTAGQADNAAARAATSLTPAALTLQEGPAGGFKGAGQTEPEAARQSPSTLPPGFAAAIAGKDGETLPKGLAVATLAITGDTKAPGLSIAQSTLPSNAAPSVHDGKSEAAQTRVAAATADGTESGPETIERLADGLAARQQTTQAVLKVIAGPTDKQTLTVVQHYSETGAVLTQSLHSGHTTVNGDAGALRPPLTTPLPVNAIAVHIAQQAETGARRFTISLDPPELGRVDVRLELSKDGKVNTHLTVERSETLDLLQRDARQLERALTQAGLETRDGSLTFSLKDHGQGQHGHNVFPQQEHANAAVEEDEAEVSAASESLIAGSGGLDIRI